MQKADCEKSLAAAVASLAPALAYDRQISLDRITVDASEKRLRTKCLITLAFDQSIIRSEVRVTMAFPLTAHSGAAILLQYVPDYRWDPHVER
jgi:hypothetical protein